jgi:hypothetical protein
LPLLLHPQIRKQKPASGLERIRAVMASGVWSSLPNGQHITFTTVMADGSSGDLMAALHVADKRLYEGKGKGRDSIWC